MNWWALLYSHWTSRDTKAKSSSHNCFVHWHTSESPNSESTYSKPFPVLTILKFNNGEEPSLIFTTEVIANWFWLQEKKKTHTNYSLTGKTTFTSSLRQKTSTNRTFMSLSRFYKKMSGKRELTREKVPSSLLFSIGAITLKQSQLTQKILSGNISLGIIAYYMPFWLKWKTPILSTLRIDSIRLLLLC